MAVQSPFFKPACGSACMPPKRASIKYSSCTSISAPRSDDFIRYLPPHPHPHLHPPLYALYVSIYITSAYLQTVTRRQRTWQQTYFHWSYLVAACRWLREGTRSHLLCQLGDSRPPHARAVSLHRAQPVFVRIDPHINIYPLKFHRITIQLFLQWVGILSIGLLMCRTREQGEEQLRLMLDAGIKTFVCLQVCQSPIESLIQTFAPLVCIALCLD